VPFDNYTLRRIYDRASGYCHLCQKKLAFSNYGRPGRKGAWHVEHSVLRANGGTDHLNNLLPACIERNLEKTTVTSRTARSWYGRTRAPLSRDKRLSAKRSNALVGGIAGGLLGLVAGPLGSLIGVAIGAKLGYDKNPDKE